MLAEAFDMGVHEVASSLVRSQSQVVIHTCKCCGEMRGLTAWKRLHLCTSVRAPDGRSSGLEFRQCPCGSTLVLDVEVLDAP